MDRAGLNAPEVQHVGFDPLGRAGQDGASCPLMVLWSVLCCVLPSINRDWRYTPTTGWDKLLQ